uniref:Putative secreted protein n=1 Tax=Anopheles darlingi TaxID=43151 RepID=A0A2M4D1V1_ANODA
MRLLMLLPSAVPLVILLLLLSAFAARSLGSGACQLAFSSALERRRGTVIVVRWRCPMARCGAVRPCSCCLGFLFRKFCWRFSLCRVE